MSDFRSPWEELAPYLARAGETIANAVLQNNNMFLQEKDNAVNQISTALQDPMLSQEDRDFLTNKLRGIEGANNMQDLRSWTQTTKPVTRIIEGPGMAPMDGGGVSLGAPTIQLDVGAQPGVTEATASAVATAEQNRQNATLGLQLSTPILENIYSITSSGFFDQLSPEQQQRVNEIEQNVSILMTNPATAKPGQLVGFMSELANIQASIGNVEDAVNIAGNAANALMQSWNQENAKPDEALASLGAFKNTPMWNNLTPAQQEAIEAEASNRFGFSPSAFKESWFNDLTNAINSNSPVLMDGLPDEAWQTAASALGVTGWTQLEGEELYSAVRNKLIARGLENAQVENFRTSQSRIDYLSQFTPDEILNVLDSDPDKRALFSDEEIARATRIAQSRTWKEAIDSPEVQTAYDVLETAGNGTTQIGAPGSPISWNSIDEALTVLQQQTGLTDMQRDLITSSLLEQQAGLDAAVAQAERDAIFRAAGIIPEWDVNDYRTQMLNLKDAADAQFLLLQNNVNDENIPCVTEGLNGVLSFASGGVCDALRADYDRVNQNILRTSEIATEIFDYSLIPTDVDIRGFDQFDILYSPNAPTTLDALSELAAMARSGASVEEMNARADEFRSMFMPREVGAAPSVEVRGAEGGEPAASPDFLVSEQDNFLALADVLAGIAAGEGTGVGPNAQGPLLARRNEILQYFLDTYGLTADQAINYASQVAQQRQSQVLFPSESSFVSNVPSQSIVGPAPEPPAQAPDAPAGETPFTGNFSNATTASMAEGSSFAESRGSDNPYAAINEGPADVTGGWSYGKYQFSGRQGTLGEFVNYLRDNYPNLYNTIESQGQGVDGGINGSDAFQNAWLNLSKVPEFQRAQDEFAEQRFFGRAVSDLRDLNYNPDSLDPVVLQALGEIKVNMDKAFKTVVQNVGNLSTMSPEEAITRLFAERLRQDGDTLVWYRSSTPEMQRNVKRNLEATRDYFLGLLRREQ